jgi:citrate synthase
MLQDPDTRIVRPRQLYEGPAARDYLPIEQRTS